MINFQHQNCVQLGRDCAVIVEPSSSVTDIVEVSASTNSVLNTRTKQQFNGAEMKKRAGG